MPKLSLSLFFQAVRPKTLWLSVTPVFVGSIMALSEKQFNLLAFFLALFGALSLQMGTNLYNDYADFKKGADTKERLGPIRVTAQGLLTPKQVLHLAYAMFACTCILGLGLVAIAGWPLVIVGLLSIACGFAYTGGPYPLAYLGLGEVFVLIFFGIVAVCTTYFVHTGHVSSASFLAGLALGFLACAVLIVNNLRDRHTDAQANKQTLAVRFGAWPMRILYNVLLLSAFLIPLWSYISGIGKITWLLTWLCLPYAVKLGKALWYKEGAELNAYLGATARLQLFYSLLFGVGAWW